MTTELAPLFAVFAPLNAQIAVVDARMAEFAKHDLIGIGISIGVGRVYGAIADRESRDGRAAP